MKKIAYLMAMRNLALVLCCGFLFVACDDDDTNPSDNNNNGNGETEEFPADSPLGNLGEDWHFVAWGMEIRSTVGLPPDNLHTIPLRTFTAFTREVGVEPDGLAINGFDLLPTQSVSTDWTTFGGPSFGEFADEFDDLDTSPGSLHNWTSDGSGDFPAFDVDVVPVPPFEVLLPQVNSSVSRTAPLQITWNGPAADGAANSFCIIHVYDQAGTSNNWVINEGGNSFTVPAETMATYATGVAVQVQVNKYSFIMREIDGEEYYFGTLSSSQNAVQAF